MVVVGSNEERRDDLVKVAANRVDDRVESFAKRGPGGKCRSTFRRSASWSSGDMTLHSH